MGKKEELEKLIAERDRLYEDHLKEHEKIAKKSFEWSIKNHKGGLDGYNPYDEEYRKVNIKFLEKVKKINAELEQLKD
ncbi:unknown [Phascolarctobacterium sp. CAG:266]|nr:unknown [Phascolarctobacterium sp. CAG:266]